MRGQRLPRVIAFHKPRGVVVSRVSERGAPTLFMLLPDQLCCFFAVGRLGQDSEGLILLCDDSRVAQRLMDPGVLPQTYLVTVRGLPSEAALDRVRAGGMELGGRTTRPVKVRRVGEAPGVEPAWRWCSTKAAIGTSAVCFTLWGTGYGGCKG